VRFSSGGSSSTRVTWIEIFQILGWNQHWHSGYDAFTQLGSVGSSPGVNTNFDCKYSKKFLQIPKPQPSNPQTPAQEERAEPPPKRGENFNKKLNPHFSLCHKSRGMGIEVRGLGFGVEWCLSYIFARIFVKIFGPKPQTLNPKPQDLDIQKKPANSRSRQRQRIAWNADARKQRDSKRIRIMYFNLKTSKKSSTLSGGCFEFFCKKINTGCEWWHAGQGKLSLPHTYED